MKEAYKNNLVPIRMRKVRMKLAKPKIIEIDYTGRKVDPNFRFQLIKYSYCYVPTTFPFWKVLIFIYRWFIWSFNTMLWLAKVILIF